MSITDKSEIIKVLESKLYEIKPALKDKVKTEDDMKEVWGLDSLDLVEFVARIEYHYKISIPDEDLQHFKSLNGIISYLQKKLK